MQNQVNIQDLMAIIGEQFVTIRLLEKRLAEKEQKDATRDLPRKAGNSDNHE